jgi:lipopolysaccharide transport system permease protein
MRKYIDKTKSIIGLSLSLAKANFKLRNEGSYLGILWYLLEPLAFFLIIVKLRNILNIEIEHFQVYLFLGLIMFNLFSKSTGAAVRIIETNRGFIKSLKINYESFVLGSFLQTLYSHLFEIILLIIIMVSYGVSPVNLVWYPIILVIYSFFILGISFILAIIGTYIKDFNNIWGIFTTLLWFATPIFYFIKEIGLNVLNPLYHFLTISREIIIYNNFNPNIYFYGIIVASLLTFIIGLMIFRKLKYNLAEKI